MLETRNIHPRRYIRWAYMQLRPTHQIVWVPMITSPKMVSSFEKDGGRDAPADSALLIRLQLDQYMHQVLTLGRDPRKVLEDELLDLGDAVRYAVSRKLGMDDIAERWRRGAELDIENEPVYAELLSPFLR